jgi:short-subunit dehydrogenase
MTDTIPGLESIGPLWLQIVLLAIIAYFGIRGLIAILRPLVNFYNLQGKTVLITGASSGIGKQVAIQLAKDYKCHVILTARGAAALAEVVKEIEAAGGKATAVPCDCTNNADVERAFAGLTPDVLINCAGIGPMLPLEQYSAEQIQGSIAAPYLAAFFVTKFFLGQFKTQDRGVVVLINSAACVMPFANTAAYSSARWAMRGLFESLRMEVYGSGVRAVHVVLWETDTPYWKDGSTQNRVPFISKMIPKMTAENAAWGIIKAVRTGVSEMWHSMPAALLYESYLWTPKGLFRQLLHWTSPRSNTRDAGSTDYKKF